VIPLGHVLGIIRVEVAMDGKPAQDPLPDPGMHQFDIRVADVGLGKVPMPSEQKPDIDGFHEGDRVRLIKPFKGETVRYEPGRTGTFVITDTAPAQISLGRQEGLYTVLIDGPDWRLIGVSRGDIKKIPGRMRVSYYDDTIQVFE
jgi:hypothetical protein